MTGIQPVGEGRYFHTRLDPIFDPDGTLSEVMGVSVDVTDAWLDKQELRQLRQQHRRIERGWLLDRVTRAAEEKSDIAAPSTSTTPSRNYLVPP